MYNTRFCFRCHQSSFSPFKVDPLGTESGVHGFHSYVYVEIAELYAYPCLVIPIFDGG